MVCFALIVGLAACEGDPKAAATPVPSPAASTSPSPITSPIASPSAEPAPPSPTPAAPACGDPTAHVYHAYRLQLIDPCRTVTGVITSIRSEADGDYHVRLMLDPQFASMLRPANTSGEHGDLVLEPICQHAVTQADAMAPCAGGLPLIPIPPIGTHVSATGSYVLDNQHGGWAELHPLFEIHAG
ncbi:MAG: hypothetical protein QOK05_716 [Chloroflexota bacterium]|jgi:hypothetical protein|nr:hypothetical protein [Chloroflexota bacterium]